MSFVLVVLISFWILTAVFNWFVRVGDLSFLVRELEVGLCRRSSTNIYKTLDDIPKEIGDKVKFLMWTPVDGRTIYEGFGMRIGPSVFYLF